MIVIDENNNREDTIIFAVKTDPSETSNARRPDVKNFMEQKHEH